MKRTKKLALLLAAMMILASIASAASAAQTTLRFAGQFPPDHTATGFMKDVAKEVSVKSNGHIDIKIFPANQLGDYTLVYEELIRGTIDMALISVPSQLSFCKASGVLFNFLYGKFQAPFFIKITKQFCIANCFQSD